MQPRHALAFETRIISMFSASIRPGNSHVANQSIITVMSGLALEVAVNRWLKPRFEAETPHRLAIDWRPTTAIMASIDAGHRADIVIAIDSAMDRLCAAGIVRTDTRATLADSILGVGVRQGAPTPDISTVDAFKRAMCSARAVAYSKAGASGIYFAKLIERLGIAEQVNARAIVIPMGFTAERVANGEADLAIQQISELMTVPGIDIAGPFPAEIQTVSTFDAAIFSDAEDPDGAAAFLAQLTSAAAAKAYNAGGLVSRLSLV
jgi:molybdate transport system substrate-binding protein